MTYSSLMVHIEPESFPNARVHIAVQLAERFGARLIGSCAQAPRPPLVADGIVVDAGAVEAESKRIERNLGLAGERFRAAAANAAPGVEWRSSVGLPTDFVVQQARAADLIIIGKTTPAEDRDFARTAGPGDVIMKGGRPVLLIPRRSTALSVARILVAWSDTREARRAIWDALPLLAGAEDVVLLALEDPDRAERARASIEDLAAYLKCHRIQPRIDLRLDAERPAGEAIIHRAEDEGADLVVAGAYGHSRMREWILGGVTRSLLEDRTVPCLLSH